MMATASLEMAVGVMAVMASSVGEEDSGDGVRDVNHVAVSAGIGDVGAGSGGAGVGAVGEGDIRKIGSGDNGASATSVRVKSVMASTTSLRCRC